jgi:O-methyltransferase involved in polyketide biosynthesis
MARGSRRIAPTAHFTAQAWVHEGFSHADLFDTATGRVLFRTSRWALERLGPRAPSLPWHIQFLLIRHYAVEARLDALAPSYVLEIGAGLSPRGLAVANRRPDVTYVELDLPGLVRQKRRRLERVSLPPNYHLAEGDLLDPDLARQLPVRRRPSDTVVVITEGVLDYLTQTDRARAFSTIARFLRDTGGGHHLFESYTRERLRKYPVSAAAMLRLLRTLVGVNFEEHLFSSGREAACFSEAAGYDRVTLLDLETLNTSPYRPPMDYCHFDLLEGYVGARS